MERCALYKKYMNFYRDIQRRWWLYALFAAACALVYWMAAYVLVFRGTRLWELWLPTSEANDEFFYNRQVLGVLSGGIKGYFGYNESHAAIGHYAAWGPFAIWAYALPSLLVGGGFNALFWSNLLFTAAGWVVFVLAVRPSAKQQITFAVMVAVLWLPIQQIFTAMTEPLHFFLLFCIIGGAIGAKRDSRWWSVSLAACALEAVIRPYGVIFFLFPWISVGERKKSRRILCGICGVVALAISLFSLSKLSAPYFVNTINTTAIELAASGNIPGSIVCVLQQLVDSVQTMFALYVLPTLGLSDRVMDKESIYVGYGILRIFVMLVISLILCVGGAIRKHPVRYKVCALVCTGLILLAIFGVYSVGQIGRYSTLICMILLTAALAEDEPQIPVYIPFALLLCFMQGEYQPTPLPRYNPEMEQQMQVIESALDQEMQNCESTDPWDHTIAFTYADNVWDGYECAVPAGMGIQFDLSTYIADPSQPMYSRYVMAGHDTAAAQRLLADGWEELVSTEALVVYKRPAV